MMNLQPDKFFREKLEDHKRPAPENAWARIESNLDKKNNKALWFKIAASLLLVAIAGYIFWPASPEIKTKQIAHKQNETLKEKASEKIDQTSLDVIEETHHDSKSSITKQVKVKSQKSFEKENENEKESLALQTKIEIEKPVAFLTDTIELTIVYEPSVEKQIASINTIEDQSSSTTLVYTAAEVNEKYLTKIDSTKATTDEKKPSTFKKLLNLALELKSNQDPVGDLRQKKNEILALNFKKEKRGQNK